MYDSVISTGITRLYGFQPSSVVLCILNSDLWPQLLVSIGPRLHLWFSACKTACLASESLVSMDPSPHLWFLHAKQRLLHPNRKSLCVPDITCCLCLQCSVISTRTTCLYGFQPFSVVFSFKTAPFGAELQVCMGHRPHLSFCPCKSAWLAPEILVSMGPRHNLSFCACKTAWLALEILVSIGPSPHLWLLHSKQRLLV